MMSIAATVSDALAFEGVEFDILSHTPTYTAAETARLAGIDPEKLAKAVLLKDANGYLLAVVPSNRALDLEALHVQALELAMRRAGFHTVQVDLWQNPEQVDVTLPEKLARAMDGKRPGKGLRAQVTSVVHVPENVGITVKGQVVHHAVTVRVASIF
jgi:hypothetical protein